MHDTMPLSSFLQKERPRTAAFSPAYTPPRYSKSGELPTQPSPKLTLTPSSHLRENVWLGRGGWAGFRPLFWTKQAMSTRVQKVYRLKDFVFGLTRERFESSLGSSWLNDVQYTFIISKGKLNVGFFYSSERGKIQILSSIMADPKHRCLIQFDLDAGYAKKFSRWEECLENYPRRSKQFYLTKTFWSNLFFRFFFRWYEQIIWCSCPYFTSASKRVFNSVKYFFFPFQFALIYYLQTFPCAIKLLLLKRV